MRNNNKQAMFYVMHNRELSEIFISYAIRNFAIGMLQLFVPIFLYQLNYTLTQILYFYMSFYFFMFCFFLAGSVLSEKIGVKHTILFSVPFSVLFLVMLYTMKAYSWPLILLGIVGGIENGFFWSAFHLYFAASSDKKKRGQEVGYLNGLGLIFTVVAPLVGGLIAGLISFKVLFGVGIIILFLSVIPIFLSKEKKLIVKIDFKKFMKKKHLFEDFAFFSEGVRVMVTGLFWPVYIYLIGLDIVLIGIASTAANFFYVLFNFLMGKIVDAYDKIKIIKIGETLQALSIFIRGFAYSFWSVLFFWSFGGVSSAILEIPYLSIFYDKSVKTKYFLVFVREFYLTISRFFILGIGILALYFFKNISTAFLIVFFLGGICCFFHHNIKLNY